MSAKFLKTAALFLQPLFALGLFTVAHVKYLQTQRAESSFSLFIRQMERNDFTEAQKSIEAAINLYPDNAHYLSNKALLHERMLRRRFDWAGFKKLDLSAAEMAHLKTAIEFYQQVLKLNPHDDHAYHNLGWLYWLLRRREEAFAHLRQAIIIDRDNPLYHVSLGLLHEYCDEQADAFGEYAQALVLSPSISDSPFFLELRERGPSEAERLLADATAYFEHHARLATSPTLKAKLGKLYLDRQPDRAVEVLKEVTTDLPSLSRPWFNLGYWYELHGDEKRMEQSYRKVFFLEGQEVAAFFRLGNYYDRHERPQEAIRLYGRAVHNWINQPTTHASRVRRIYLSRFTVRDDVIPRGLSAYTNPAFDVAWTCARLATLYSETGKQDLAEYYRKLGEEYVP